jgi:SAM-dependent methyltransferase
MWRELSSREWNGEICIVAKEFPQHLLNGLDQADFETLIKSSGERREHKLSYADVELWLARSWKAAKRLGLDKSQSLDVLDIGIGPGYFLYVCQQLGHRCVGIDRPGDYPFWKAVRHWLGVNHVVEHSIEPRQLLPKTLGSFDLVSAFRAQFNFNNHAKRLWTLDEWSFFLDDLRDHVLRPSGRFVLKLAKQEHKGNEGLKRSDSELTKFMVGRGAKVEGTVLLFAPLR